MLTALHVATGEAGTLEVSRGGVVTFYLSFPSGTGSGSFLFLEGDSVRWATGAYPSVHYTGGEAFVPVPANCDCLTIVRTTETTAHGSMGTAIVSGMSVVGEEIPRISVGVRLCWAVSFMLFGAAMWAAFQRARR